MQTASSSGSSPDDGVAAAEMKAAREEAGITPELMKKLAEAQKALKDSEKKGKDRMAAIHEAAGLSWRHQWLAKKMTAAEAKKE